MSHLLDKDSEAFINALRGLAALAVLITHSLDFGIRGVYGHSLLEAPVFWRWMAASVGHGSFLVWCFFVVSGLCIHLSIMRSTKLGAFDWRSYAVARVTRIYPLFLLGLLLAILVWWFTDDLSGTHATRPWPQFFSSLLSLHIFTNSFPNFMTSWSLSNEMLYYAAWPLLLCIVGWRASKAVALGGMASLLVCLLIGVLWTVLRRFETSTAINGLWSVCVLFPLWLGGAWLAENWQRVSQHVSRRLWYISFPLCLAAELILAWVKFNERSQAVIDSTALLALPGLMLLLAGSRHARLSSPVWLQPWIRWFGQFSYPCYILQMPLLVLQLRLVIPYLPEPVVAHPLARASVILLPTLLLLSYTGPWLERGIMAWRSKFLARLES